MKTLYRLYRVNYKTNESVEIATTESYTLAINLYVRGDEAIKVLALMLDYHMQLVTECTPLE